MNKTSYLKEMPFSVRGGEWFPGAGFGLFIHWDHSSQRGTEISYPMVGVTFDFTDGHHDIYVGTDDPEKTITVADYHSTAATFNPTEWDPRAFARLARESGAQYVVFTARHLNGYSMFHTQYSDRSIEYSPYQRDITRELVDALHAENLKVGLYYSLPDWGHPDYPGVQDSDRPFGFNKQNLRRSSPEEWERFKEYQRNQLTELLTNYGRIDLLWFDLKEERTEEEWEPAKLRELVKSLQPHVIINDRLPGHGDYLTPEQTFPLEPPTQPWELCQTIGGQWTWSPDNSRNKSSHTILRTLVEVVSQGGNYLLNIGPRGDGRLDPAQVAVVGDIAAWMRHHAESVIDTYPVEGFRFYGPATGRPGRVYLYLVALPVEDIVVRGVPIDRVEGARVLATGEKLGITKIAPWAAYSDPALETIGELRIKAPASSGALIDVVAIDLKTEDA